MRSSDAVAGDDEVHVRQAYRCRSVFSFSAGHRRRDARRTFEAGANRPSSAAQLASSEAGAPEGYRSDAVAPLRAETSSSDRTWIVLPRPMSSARQAPSPSCVSR